MQPEPYEALHPSVAAAEAILNIYESALQDRQTFRVASWND